MADTTFVDETTVIEPSWCNTVTKWNVLDKSGDYTILAADTDDRPGLLVKVDASGGTRTITLPTAANFDSKRIVVVADAAPGSNKVTINDSGASEYWTCYEKGDFVEIISDGTNVTFVNGHVSVYGQARPTGGNQAFAANSAEQLNEQDWTIDTNVGGWFDGTNDRFNIGFDCIFNVVLNLNGSRGGSSERTIMAGFKINNTTWVKDITGTTKESTPEAGYANEATVHFLKLSSGNTLEPWGQNIDSDTEDEIEGATSQLSWSVLRRIK